jgi:hypothetical protein
MKQSEEELARLLRSYLDVDEEHPDAEEILFRYVDGTLDSERRADVEAHLEECARCREDVADLEETHRTIGRRRHPISWLIAAAAAAIAIAAAFWWSQQERTVRPRIVHAAVLPPEWNAVVQQAREKRRIDPPAAFRALQADRDTLRGRPVPHAGGTFSPSGTIVETQQPSFRWPAVDSAGYVVKIFEDEKEILRSPLLHESRWTPPRTLARGVTYVWQIAAHSDSVVTILPAPPDPPALFTILDAKEMAGIDAARRQFPDNHFLLGVLYARAGVRDRAEDELGRWIAVHPTDAAARDLLSSVEAW